MSEKSLVGRKALVTGGARGIGAAIAEALTKAGASVMIGDILADLGKETAGRLAKTGGKTGFVELNVTDDAQWEKAVAATIAALGGYDILINNAGIEITSLVIDVKAEDLRRMCDVNIVGTGLGMKHAFRAMRPGGPAGTGGAIVNIASVAGHCWIFGHQIRCRPHDESRSDGSGQTRLRRPCQLSLSRACPDRHGNATGWRHCRGRACGRSERGGRVGHRANAARSIRRGW